MVCRDQVRLSVWAKWTGVRYLTAWEWARDGEMPVPVVETPSGSWLVVEPEVPVSGRIVAYCRVLSAGQKTDLGRQVWRPVQGGSGVGLSVAVVVTEVGSGLGGRRRKLHRSCRTRWLRVIVVVHRDRLVRFGVEHLESVLAASGRRLVVLDSQETSSDLAGDIAEVLTWMCARLCGQRAAKDRAARAIAVVTEDAA